MTTATAMTATRTPEQRRGVRRTVVWLVLAALAVFAGFILSGVIGR